MHAGYMYVSAISSLSPLPWCAYGDTVMCVYIALLLMRSGSAHHARPNATTPSHYSPQTFALRRCNTFWKLVAQNTAVRRWLCDLPFAEGLAARCAVWRGRCAVDIPCHL